MLTRLSVGRVEPWELVLSVTLLVATILVTSVIAIRIYGAGVLLYGQRPGLRAYVAGGAGPVALERPAWTDAVGTSGFRPHRALRPRRWRHLRRSVRPHWMTARVEELWAVSFRPASAGATAEPGAIGASRTTSARRNRPAALLLEEQRQAADQRDDRRRRGHGTLRGSGSDGARGSSGRRQRRHEPPQPAPDARQVRARALAGHDPGDPLRRGRLVERPALPGDRGHGDDLVARPEHLPQGLAPAARAAPTAASARRGAGDRTRDRPPAGPARQRSRRASSSPSASPFAPTTTSSPSSTADRASTRTASPANSGSVGQRLARRRRRTSTSPAPGASAGPMNASARSPPHDGSKKCSPESNGSCQRSRQHRPERGREVRENVGTSGSSRSDSWSRIVPRW